MLPCKPVHILVTAAGAAHAISVITSLRAQVDLPVKVVAADMSPLSAGLHLADEYTLLPRVDSPSYVDALLQVCTDFRIECLLPMHSKEVPVILAREDEFQAVGVRTYLPPGQAVSILDDKWETFLFWRSIGVDTPETVLIDENTPLDCFPFPYIVKGRRGSGARSVAEVVSLDCAKVHLCCDRSCVAQEKAFGQEITVDFLADEDQTLICAVARERLRVSDGKSTVGRTVQMGPIRDVLQHIVTVLKYKGVGNLQLFRDGTKHVYTELNPRFAAGGLPLSIRAGHHLPVHLIRLMRGEKVAPCPPAPVGVIMLRYYTEVFTSW